MGNLALWDGGQRNPNKKNQLIQISTADTLCSLTFFLKSLNLTWALTSPFLVLRLS